MRYEQELDGLGAGVPEMEDRVYHVNEVNDRVRDKVSAVREENDRRVLRLKEERGVLEHLRQEAEMVRG